MKSLAILFAGDSAPVAYIDGSTAEVFVRLVPQRFLGRALQCAEFKTALIELCCYLKADAAVADPAAISAQLSASAHPDIPAPAGLCPVPLGWTDNLSDASVDQLYEKAKDLNFQRAADWAKGQIAAKKLVAPLHEMAVGQVIPLAMQILEPLIKKLEALSPSMPSAPSSSGTPAKSS